MREHLPRDQLPGESPLTAKERNEQLLTGTLVGLPAAGGAKVIYDHFRLNQAASLARQDSMRVEDAQSDERQQAQQRQHDAAGEQKMEQIRRGQEQARAAQMP